MLCLSTFLLFDLNLDIWLKKKKKTNERKNEYIKKRVMKLMIEWNMFFIKIETLEKKYYPNKLWK